MEWRYWILILCCFLFVRCGTGTTSDSTAATTSTTYTVGGTLSGLSGTVVLQNNAGDDLSLTADGAFTFATAVADGAAYAVTVLTQPSRQTCSVASGSGTISGANVTSVSVVCSADTYTVGGTLTGLGSGKTVVLQNNAGDNLTLSATGSFTFTTAVADAAAYAVTILTQSSGQICTVTNASGMVNLANITNVTVTCVSNLRIFETAATTKGNLKGSTANGIAGADAFCTSDSNKPSTGTYKALIVDGTNRVACTTANCGGGAGEHTDWVLAANKTYVRASDSATIGTTNSVGLFTFNLSNSFSTSSGNGNNYWSGFSSTSTWVTADLSTLCNTSGAWTADGNAVPGEMGCTGTNCVSYDKAIRFGSDICNVNNKLICVEQ